MLSSAIIIILFFSIFVGLYTIVWSVKYSKANYLKFYEPESQSISEIRNQEMMVQEEVKIQKIVAKEIQNNFNDFNVLLESKLENVLQEYQVIKQSLKDLENAINKSKEIEPKFVRGEGRRGRINAVENKGKRELKFEFDKKIEQEMTKNQGFLSINHDEAISKFEDIIGDLYSGKQEKIQLQSIKKISNKSL